MKKTRFLQSFICLLAVSCSVNELDMQVPISSEEEDVFYATLESDSEPDTRVYIDEDIKILWDAEDQVSIFNKSTLNQQYQFDGKSGDNSGTFSRVPNGYFGAGNDLDYICSVYPFQESATISNSGKLTLTLPAEQTYRTESTGPTFGRGANTMVSVTNDKLLKFKNVGGYLCLKFYGKEGKDVSVSSIMLTGKNMEKLSGEATLTPVIGGNPTITMAPETVGSSIVLNCETPVRLGTSADDATIFWMVVPPTDFEQGFTVTITAPNGDVYIQETGKHLTIERNKVLRISAAAVDFDSDDLQLNDILPVNEKPRLMTDVDEANRTITVTMPTVTDFSDLLFNYDHTGSGVMVNGVNIEYENGIPTTHINASRKTDEDGFHLATVVVRNGKYGKNYTLKARNTGLPVVRIMTKGLFTLETLQEPWNRLQYKDKYPNDTTVWKDDRVWLPESSTNNYITLRIENPDGSPGMKDGDVPIYETNTQIKGRGNYSWKWEKKPYALKLQKKKEVLGMPEHKRWVLLANWRDRTLLRNDATFWLAKKAKAELPYTTRGQFVELEFNGEYRGNYYLCEQIKINKNRVNITPLVDDDGVGFDDMSGGFLMEIDSYWDEANKFKSQYFNLRYMFKEPDEDGRLPETDNRYRTAYSTMKNYINNFEKVVKTQSSVLENYENYLDVNSAIMFMLLNELVGNGDFFQTSNDEVFGPHSTYLYKDKGEDNKLFMGPVWDFDYLTFTPKPTYGNFSWKGYDSKKYYYYFMSHDQDFVDRIKSLWNSRKTEFQKLPDYIDEMAAYLRLSQEFDEARWPYDSQYDNTTQKNRNDNKDYGLPFLVDDPNTEDAIKRMKNSFNARFNWMDGKISNLRKTTPGNSDWAF